MSGPSTAQINKLGERLRKGAPTEADFELLDEIRRSYTSAYDAVVTCLTEKLNVRPSGRPEKTTPSVIAKLQRERSRLATIQDIAGCRIVVSDGLAQATLLEQILSLYPSARVEDRRTNPKHGYRAVHIIVIAQGKPIEYSFERICSIDGQSFRKSSTINFRA